MLNSIGLDMYTHVFKQERISPEDFLTLNEKDLVTLNINASARKLILDSIANGVFNSPDPIKKLKLN